MIDNVEHYNKLQSIKWVYKLLQTVLFGSTNILASHLERSPLIHSYGYDYYRHPALALRARLRITSCNSPVGPHFVRSNLLQANLVAHANLSAGDRPTCLTRLFVSSMRLTPSGLTRYFVPDKILPIKSKPLMQYTGNI